MGEYRPAKVSKFRLLRWPTGEKAASRSPRPRKVQPFHLRLLAICQLGIAKRRGKA